MMMRKFLLLVFLCLALGCKKSSQETIADKSFRLQVATITPAMIVNGKETTNYMTLSGPDACYNNNYSIAFDDNGVYAVSSTGPLCELTGNTDGQKWTKNGDQVTLIHPNGDPIVATLSKNRLVYSRTFVNSNIKYTVVYEFKEL